MDRRQFLASGGAAAGLAYVSLGTGAASADLLPNPQLTDARRQVLLTLSQTELVAAGADPSGAAQAIAAAAAGFPNLEVPTQQTINTAIDTLQAAPSQGPFTQLDNGQRQAFMRQTVTSAEPQVPHKTSFNDQAYSQYVAAANSGTLDAEADGVAGDYPGEPPEADGLGSPPLAGAPLPTPEITPAQQLSMTALSLLSVLDDPPPPYSLVSQLIGLPELIGLPVVSQLLTGSETPPPFPAFSATLLNAITYWSS